LTPSGGELFVKPDDPARGWVSEHFSSVATSTWSHTGIQKIHVRQPWDSINYIDWIKVTGVPFDGRKGNYQLKEEQYWKVHDKRAQQGIASSGNSGWVTSSGNLGVLGIGDSPMALYKYDSSWNRLATKDCSTLTISGLGTVDVTHVGDIACGGGYTYTPLEITKDGVESTRLVGSLKNSFPTHGIV